MKSYLHIAATLLALLSQTHADVVLNPMFGDHMVLQRERPVPVWGKADPGEKVSVAFAGQVQSATADADGRWMIFLNPLAVSKNPAVLKVKGRNEISISDVLVGDVWLGSGQSNMDFKVSGTNRADAIRKMPAGSFDGLRLFIVSQASADEPQKEIAGGKWTGSATNDIMEFSATLFYFGEELHKRLPDVPLGLVRSSVGATNLYSWIPNEVREKDPAGEYVRSWWTKATQSWTPEKQAKRDEELAAYEAQVADLKQRGEKVPDTLKKPDELTGPKWSRRPSSLYNGMIAPLQPMAIRGMIWYQGEWDCKLDWSARYHDLFLAFAKSWRSHWAESSGKKSSGDFPIYLVQLPARVPTDNNGKYWPFMREAQRQASIDLPNSGYVVTHDTNDPTNMHPVEKTPIGQRLAWLALGKEYKQSIAWHGPEFKAAQTSPKSMLLDFDNGGSAIQSKDGQPLRWFELAGADGIYHPAVAEIRGDHQLLLSSPEVANPATVRYAFVPSADKANFQNAAGLPAGPFRTDKQPAPPEK